MWKRGDTINVQGAIELILVPGYISIVRPVTIICTVESKTGKPLLGYLNFAREDRPTELAPEDCLMPKDVYVGYWSWEYFGYVTFRLTEEFLNQHPLCATMKYGERIIPGHIVPQVSRFWRKHELYLLNQSFFTFVGITRFLIREQDECYRTPLKL